MVNSTYATQSNSAALLPGIVGEGATTNCNCAGAWLNRIGASREIATHAPHGTWRRRSSVSITTQRRDATQQKGTAGGGDRERAHMTRHAAANAATPDQKAVHSSLALLTCSFHDVAMLMLLDCDEEACNLGDRRGTAQRHNRAAAWAMHAMC